MTKSDLWKKRFKLAYNVRELKYIIERGIVAAGSWSRKLRKQTRKGVHFYISKPTLSDILSVGPPYNFSKQCHQLWNKCTIAWVYRGTFVIQTTTLQNQKMLTVSKFSWLHYCDHGFHIFTGEIVEVGANSTTKLWYIYKYCFTREEFTVLIALLSISVSGKRTGILICTEIPSL